LIRQERTLENINQGSAPALILTLGRDSRRSNLNGYVMWEQIQQKSVLKKRNKASLTPGNFMIADNVGYFCPSSGQFFLWQFPDTIPDSV